LEEMRAKRREEQRKFRESVARIPKCVPSDKDDDVIRQLVR